MISHRMSFWAMASVAIMAMAASVIPPFSDAIEAAANNVYPYSGPDIFFDYFTGALIGLILGVAIMALPFPSELKPTLTLCWAVKFATALFVVPIYEYAYGLDIDGYFWFAEMPGRTGGFREGTWFVRMFAWGIFQVIGPSFHGGKVIFSFIGLMGIYFIYRGATQFLSIKDERLLLFTAIAPTCLFWSTSLGKDPLCLFGVGLHCYGAMGWLNTLKLRFLPAIAIGAMIAISIRSYFAPILGIPIAVAFLVQSRHPMMKFLLLPLVAFAAYISLDKFQSSINVDSFEGFVRYQAEVVRNWQGGSSFTLPLIDSPLKLVLVAPLAIATALFRPTILEAHNAFALAAALDNTVLLILFIYALRRSKFAEIMKPIIMWMTSFVLMWSALYGIGTGNLGAISRFKIQVLPIFITLLVFMGRRRAPQAQPA